MKPFIFNCFCVCAIIGLNNCQQRQNNVATSEGAKLFSQYCVRCHLLNGQGGPSTIPGFNAVDIREQNKTQAQLIQIISYGFGKMPSFKDSTSDENIAMIAEYVAANIEKHPGAPAAHGESR